jgi:hypothetical protein
VSSEIKDGWFEIKPTQPDEAVANRLNRVALAKLIKASREKWVPSLDDVADYARYNPDPIQGGISMRYLRLAPNAMTQGFSGQGSWDVLKFYGSLNAAQRQGLKSSGTLQFGALSGESSAILARIMFGADVNLITEREAARNESMMDNMRNMMRNMTGGQQNENFLDEPTFVMPTGLPRNGFVALKINTETTLMPATPESKPDMSFGAIGLEETAFMKYMQQDENMARFATGIPTYDLVYQGQRGVYDMRFYVSPNILAKYTLHDNKMDTNAKATAFTSLPQPVQDKVSKIVDDIKKGGMPFQMMGGTGRIRT